MLELLDDQGQAMSSTAGSRTTYSTLWLGPSAWTHRAF